MRPMGTTAYGGKGQGKGKGRLGQGGRGRSKGGEKPMGTTAYGGKGSKGRAANGDRPVGAASCRRHHHTMASCQTPPPLLRGVHCLNLHFSASPLLRIGRCLTMCDFIVWMSIPAIATIHSACIQEVDHNPSECYLGALKEHCMMMIAWLLHNLVFLAATFGPAENSAASVANLRCTHRGTKEFRDRHFVISEPSEPPPPALTGIVEGEGG